MTTFDYDIIIIGSGPGGHTAALHAAKLGKKVAVIEKGDTGGVCLNKGCIPTKTIIESVKLYNKLKRAGEFGIGIGESSYNWESILGRKDRVVQKLRKGIEFMFRTHGIELVKAEGIVKEPGLVEAIAADGTSRKLTCSRIIIAAGTAASKINGFEYALTSDDLLEINEVPKELHIIGAGAVGIEFAYIFASLGSSVIIDEMMSHVLPGMDSDISKNMEVLLKKKDIQVNLNKKTSPSEDIGSGRVTLVTGRKFEKIEVDNRMRTKDQGIYAIGDVTGIANYAHVAMMQGIVAVDNCCGTESYMDYSAVPSCVFFEPEVATVGITEDQAKEINIDHKISKFTFAALGKSSASSEIEGFVKIISENKTGKVIGCHILGSSASNLIAEGVLAVRKGLTVKDIADTIHAHPTLPEAVWEAARG